MNKNTHEMQDTALAVRMLAEQAARGNVRAQVMLRQFNRGEVVDVCPARESGTTDRIAANAGQSPWGTGGALDHQKQAMTAAMGKRPDQPSP